MAASIEHAKPSNPQRYMQDRVAKTTVYEIVNNSPQTVLTLKETADDSAAQQIHKANGVDVRDGGRAHNLDGIAPAISALVDPDSNMGVIHIDDVRQAVSIYIAHQNALGVVAMGETWAVVHVDALCISSVLQRKD